MELRFWEGILFLKIHLYGSGHFIHELTLTYNVSNPTLESSSNTKKVLIITAICLGLYVQQHRIVMESTEQHAYYMYFPHSFLVL